MRTLGDVVAFTNGGTPPRSRADFWDGDIPWITGADIGASGSVKPRAFISQEAVRSSSTRVLPAGTVLLVTRTAVGKVGVLPRAMAINQDITGVTPSAELDARYLVWFLRARAVALSNKARGATIKGVSRNDVASLPLELPPVDEQRRVAAILDRADAIRAKRRQVLARLDSLTLEIFHNLFSSMYYPTQRLDELVDSDDRMNYGVVQPGDSVDGGVPLIRVSDLRDGSVSRLSLKRIAPSVERSYSRSRIRGTEILVSSVGSIGAVAVASPADIGSNIARAITRVPISNPVTRVYVAAFLRTADAQRYFRSEARVVAQPTLNVKQLAATPVPVPAFDQMRTFAEAEARVSAHRAAAQTALAATDKLFASLQSRAFRGEL